MRAPRLTTSALLLTLAGSSIALGSGVELHVKWVSPEKTCVITSTESGVSVDPATGNLSLTGSFAASNCPAGGGGTVPDPVITDGLDLSELPEQVVVNSSTTVNWAADAETCTYAGSSFPVSLPNWPTSGSGAIGCSTTAGCAANHSAPITFSQTGTYTFKLTCTKAGAANPAISTRTVVVNNTPPPGCIAPAGLTRVTSGTVKYNDGASRTTDLTLFENVFGHDPNSSTLRTFPGTMNLTQRILMPKNGYVALKFTVPANFDSATQGGYRNEETNQNDRPGAVSITISQSCGDFSTTPTSPMTTKCIANSLTMSDALPWGNTGLTARCQLQAGQTYYLNILYAPLTAPTTSACTLPLCSNPIQNQKTGTQQGIWQN